MKKLSKNTYLAVIYQFVSLIVSIVVRFFLIRLLGIEYQGLEMTMISLASIITLSEAGAETAITYSLYEPILNNNIDAVAALIKTYKKFYFMITALISGIAVVGYIFVPYIIEDSVFLHSEIRWTFSLCIIQAILSYLFIEYQSLIYTSEMGHYISAYKTIATIISGVFQILALCLLKSFYLKIVFMIIVTVIVNILIMIKAKKLFPYVSINIKCIEKTNTRELYKRIYSLTFSKIADTLIFQTDSLFASYFIGFVVTGKYSNYYLIVNGVNAFINCIIFAVQPTLTTVLVKNKYNISKQITIFEQYSLCSMFITAFSVCSYYILTQDFISLWLGTDFLLNNKTLLLLIVTQLILLLDSPIWNTLFINGCFDEIKTIGICSAIINIAISFILGKRFGLDGIIIGTIVCYCCSFVLHMVIVFKRIISSKRKLFYFLNIIVKNILQIFAACSIITFINRSFFTGLSTMLTLVLNLFLCLTLNLVIYILLNYKKIICFIRIMKEGI